MERAFTNTIKDAAGATGIQAAVISQIAPRALSLASTLFRRHPLLFVSGLAIAAWAWNKRRSSSSEVQTSPADLVH